MRITSDQQLDPQLELQQLAMEIIEVTEETMEKLKSLKYEKEKIATRLQHARELEDAVKRNAARVRQLRIEMDKEFEQNKQVHARCIKIAENMEMIVRDHTMFFSIEQSVSRKTTTPTQIPEREQTPVKAGPESAKERVKEKTNAEQEPSEKQRTEEKRSQKKRKVSPITAEMEPRKRNAVQYDKFDTSTESDEESKREPTEGQVQFKIKIEPDDNATTARQQE